MSFLTSASIAFMISGRTKFVPSLIIRCNCSQPDPVQFWPDLKPIKNSYHYSSSVTVSRATSCPLCCCRASEDVNDVAIGDGGGHGPPATADDRWRGLKCEEERGRETGRGMNRRPWSNIEPGIVGMENQSAVGLGIFSRVNRGGEGSWSWGERTWGLGSLSSSFGDSDWKGRRRHQCRWGAAAMDLRVLAAPLDS